MAKILWSEGEIPADVQRFVEKLNENDHRSCLSRLAQDFRTAGWVVETRVTVQGKGRVGIVAVKGEASVAVEVANVSARKKSLSKLEALKVKTRIVVARQEPTRARGVLSLLG